MTDVLSVRVEWATTLLQYYLLYLPRLPTYCLLPAILPSSFQFMAYSMGAGPFGLVWYTWPFPTTPPPLCRTPLPASAALRMFCVALHLPYTARDTHTALLHIYAVCSYDGVFLWFVAGGGPAIPMTI